MTSEEIEATIKRIQECGEDGDKNAARAVIAFMGGDHHREFQDKLISLLRQADPKTYSELSNDADADPKAYIELPKDADGEVINIGDVVYARYGDGDYFNGRVHSLEFEREATYAYVCRDEDSDLDQFATSRLHHGSHIPTARQILNEFAHDVFNLGVDAARNNETQCMKTYDRRREMVKTYANELAPLLSDEAETGFEAKEASR